MGAARKLTAYMVYLTFFPAIFHAGATGVAAQEKAAGASVAGRIPRSASEALRPESIITRRDIELSGAPVIGLDVMRREEMDSYTYPRDRYHASVRVKRGRVAANVSIRSWGDGGCFSG